VEEGAVAHERDARLEVDPSSDHTEREENESYELYITPNSNEDGEVIIQKL